MHKIPQADFQALKEIERVLETHAIDTRWFEPSDAPHDQYGSGVVSARARAAYEAIAHYVISLEVRERVEA